MIRHIFLLLLLAVLSLQVSAQEDDLPAPSPRPKTTDQDGPPPTVITPADTTTTSPEDFKPFKKEKKVDFSKFIIEPNFVLSFSGSRFDVGFSPYVGYNVWKGLYLGGGATYYYTGASENINGLKVKYNFQTYGGGVFAQYRIWRGFFARAKLELLERRIPTGTVNFIALPGSTPQNPQYTYKVDYMKKFTPSLLIGVGYNLVQSRNIFVPIVISYNVLNSLVDKQYSLYPRGIVVQLGFINLF